MQIEFLGELEMGSAFSMTACYNDFIEIRDGEDEESPLIMKLCGSKKPEVMYSQGRSLWIRFQSYYTFKGFSLKVTQVEPPECKSNNEKNEFISCYIINKFLFILFRLNFL